MERMISNNYVKRQMPTGNQVALLFNDNQEKYITPANPLNFPKEDPYFKVNENSNLAKLKGLQNPLQLGAKQNTLGPSMDYEELQAQRQEVPKVRELRPTNYV